MKKGNKNINEVLNVTYNIEDAVLDKKIEEIYEQTDKLQTIIEETFQADQLVLIEEFVNRQKNIIISCVRELSANEDVYFALGRYAGVLDFCNTYLKKIIHKEVALNRITNSEAKNIPHINDIIKTIKKQPGIRHGHLAELVGIEKNSLSPIMERLTDNEFVAFSRPGKFKFYYLTKNGESYYKEYIEQFELNENLDYIIEQLLLTLANSEERSELVAKIVKAMYSGQYKFEGYKVKNDKTISPVDWLPSIISQKPVNAWLSDFDLPLIIGSAEIVSLGGNTTLEPIVIFKNSNSAQLSISEINCIGVK